MEFIVDLFIFYELFIMNTLGISHSEKCIVIMGKKREISKFELFKIFAPILMGLFF